MPPKKIKSFVISTDGTHCVEDIPDTLEALQKIVEGNVTIIPKLDVQEWKDMKIVAYANEEGLLERLPRNFHGELLLHALGFYINPDLGISGNIAIIGEGRDGNNASLRPEYIKVLDAGCTVLDWDGDDYDGDSDRRMVATMVGAKKMNTGGDKKKKEKKRKAASENSKTSKKKKKRMRKGDRKIVTT